jgi:FkbM family methyltransferase
MSETRSFEVHSTFEIEGVADNDKYINIVSGQFEKRFQQLANRTLPKHAVAFDIGANIGVVSIVLGSIFCGGKVFAVEPGPRVFQVLDRNLRRNELHNVVPLRYAVSDTMGEVTFSENSAYGHIASGEANAEGLSSAKCVTIDWLANDLDLSRLDLVKVDIEGFEPQAMRAADRVIERFNPMFLIELNPWCMRNYGGNDPVQFVKDMQTRFEHVLIINKNYGEDAPLKRIDVDELFNEIGNPASVFVDDIIVTNNPGVLAALDS